MCDDVIGRLPVPVNHQDMRPFGCHSSRDGRTQAASASSHHRRLTRKSNHEFCSFLFESLSLKRFPTDVALQVHIIFAHSRNRLAMRAKTLHNHDRMNPL